MSHSWLAKTYSDWTKGRPRYRSRQQIQPIITGKSLNTFRKRREKPERVRLSGPLVLPDRLTSPRNKPKKASLFPGGHIYLETNLFPRIKCTPRPKYLVDFFATSLAPRKATVPPPQQMGNARPFASGRIPPERTLFQGRKCTPPLEYPAAFFRPLSEQGKAPTPPHTGSPAAFPCAPLTG